MMDLEELFDIPDDKLDYNMVAKIRRRRRQLLVHSYLYYRMNTNIISDNQYDEWARELIQLQEEYTEESKKADFYEDFKGFQMGDSFALPLDQAWIHEKSIQLVRYHNELKGT
jgi:hypothetical protein